MIVIGDGAAANVAVYGRLGTVVGATARLASERKSRRRRLLGAAGCWTLTLACGSGAIQPPYRESTVNTATPAPSPAPSPAPASATTTSSGPSTSSSRPLTSTTPPTTTTTAAETEIETEEYSWRLPIGPRTPSINEDILYPKIQQGDCDAAQTFLDENWRSLGSPRTVLLYQAGVLFCAGRNTDARRFFEQADREYGWSGVDVPALDCLMYRAAASVVHQQAPDDFPCPSGSRPRWPAFNPDVPRDDPRTPENESSVTTATTTTASTATSTTHGNT